MAKIAGKVATVIAALAIVGATGAAANAAVGNSVDDTVSVAQVDTQTSQSRVVVDNTNSGDVVSDAVVESVEASVEVEAPVVEETVSEAPEASGVLVVNVNCRGSQAEIDTCVGATNYAPVADYLGVPYYAQHNGMGGEAWLASKVGDTVVAEGVTYTISQIRTVDTGGALAQIEGMGGDAYLQTCMDDNIHSKVYALKKA